jgi:hypothetical protein
VTQPRPAFRNDPDETEGRRLYRAYANGEARRDMAKARHRVTWRVESQ